MAEYESLRQRHLADLAALLPEHTQRLHWPAERLGRERRERLRDLLRVAGSSSPWHRDRLAGVDPDGFEETDLASLPPMTKDDLMANWDAVVTDRRLTLDLVEGHLAGLEADAYLFGEFHAVASGGSSGRRGIFVFGWRAWATAYAGFMRPALLDRAVTPGAGCRPDAGGHDRGQERHPHDQRDTPDLRQPGGRHRPVPGDAADRPDRGRAQRLPAAGPHGMFVLVVGEILKITIVERIFHIGREKLLTIKAFALVYNFVWGWLTWI